MSEPSRSTDLWREVQRPTNRQLAFDIAVGCLLAVTGYVLQIATGTSGLISVVLLAAAIGVRRFSVLLMSALAVSAIILQVVRDSVVPVADLGFAVLLFSLGSHYDGRVRRFGLAAAVLAVALGGGYLGLSGYDVDSLTLGMAIIAIVTVGGWTSGVLRWQSQEVVQARVQRRIDEAEREALAVRFQQQAERNRIATDMHDVVAHSLAVVAAQADGARYALNSSPERAEASLEVIGETARSAISDLRHILARLRTGEDQAYIPAPDDADLFERMRASGMSLATTERGRRDPSSLAAVVSHRLLAEALTNALKHGDLTQPVRCEQDWREGYRLTVTNAVDADSEAIGTGHGLLGMRERVQVAGGTLTTERTGDQFVLRAELPPVRGGVAARREQGR